MLPKIFVKKLNFRQNWNSKAWNASSYYIYHIWIRQTREINRATLSDISVYVRGWLEWWDGARAPWSSGRPVSGPAPQPPPPSISPLLLPATQRAASIAMEASKNQQQKEKEPRVHRPYAFDKVHPRVQDITLYRFFCQNTKKKVMQSDF